MVATADSSSSCSYSVRDEYSSAMRVSGSATVDPSSKQMMDELTGLRFLWIGDFVTWSPYVMLAAAAVQIPIWFTLTVRAYRRPGS